MTAFRHRFQVRFADVDHAGIVYYPVYYHYFHVAFEELFRERMGAKAYLDLLDRRKIGFPAVHSECDYKAPLRFADTAEVAITLSKMGTKSLTLQYDLHRIDADERVRCAVGKVVCAITDLQAFQAVALPDDLKALFLELSDSAG